MTRLRGTLFLGDDAIADPLWIARAPAERMRGLLGRRGLPNGEALLIEGCGAIHMFGMRFAIDVAFLDADGRVVASHAAVRPWTTASGGPGARYALEAGAGWLPPAAMREGTRLRWTVRETS